MFDLWSALQSIRQYKYESKPGEKSVMGWAGEGQGSVSLRLEKDTLFFTETGQFVLAQNGHKVETNNEFIWQKLSDTRIRLLHSRFGRDKQVELFELIYHSESDSWESEQAHLCGDDIYSSKVIKGEQGIEFFWSITGPRKQENLHYRYSR
ncbi:hypothetical protein JCM19241_2016 [Vibrio ishigakensis]|uniref:DUF6314 domain-containing protein n=1 Tax=Vibrio ishigakensis TaxID=1481914 RepID=A0A0B8QJ69_9VIBR|nr:hypothetical protein JCM19241_2016 [Vibrio ishigakensis]